ncbi:hypothetical protein [Aneurinibacillus aneurinilyticus]|jgi:hypothetical protein|uniref:Uncharacterized protein n=1 Tax=Aneurinibacillus aneurinilyticus ATCC 12856 TaxID=649747 RepID=U1XBD4_ANEAE|nr:hypothetical protein [Aneurinibacillus aneurinilyticus]ERI11853.1 hypothetical protein HMPREF0083_00049 [Aneurinibacillus aneurinilyticus ATCC 12856]MCI1694769.1 hypothetical protein [Aneurinibacillus aneurinilyticus]MED0672671.1 hypothetical protein [Aneurinibacillus aneurinilyticus]MED0705288.1 hypothetical protein [Aneurinibacillus aneurinilyticus]MED0722464.1 hypothetical protein [Aneurinibacillus aneurinilyticus]
MEVVLYYTTGRMHRQDTPGKRYKNSLPLVLPGKKGRPFTDYPELRACTPPKVALSHCAKVDKYAYAVHNLNNPNSMPKFLNLKTTKALPLFHPCGSEDRASVNCVNKNKSQYLLSSISYKLIHGSFKE